MKNKNENKFKIKKTINDTLLSASEMEFKGSCDYQVHSTMQMHFVPHLMNHSRWHLIGSIGLTQLKYCHWHREDDDDDVDAAVSLDPQNSCQLLFGHWFYRNYNLQSFHYQNDPNLSH